MLFPLYIGDDKTRYILGTQGNKTLLVMGINPSKATNLKSDSTITRIKFFCEINNYDSFLMINVYPFRSTDPNKLPLVSDDKLHNKNRCTILDNIIKYKFRDLLCCWGDNISIRPYLKIYLFDIYSLINPKLKNIFCLGDLTIDGNPRHPGRLSYKTNFNRFIFNSYVKNHSS